MVRNYLRNDPATQANAGRPSATPATTPSAAAVNPLRELQRRYAKTLAACYALHAEGSRCRFEDDPVKTFDCSHCLHSDSDRFCKANLHLKKVVGLVAEFLAHKNSAAPARDEKPQPGWSAETVESFKAKGMSYEIETPLRDEHIWIVPQRTGKDRNEFTPEEMAFFLQAMDAVGGKIVEIDKKRREADAEAASEEDRA